MKRDDSCDSRLLVDRRIDRPNRDITRAVFPDEGDGSSPRAYIAKRARAIFIWKNSKNSNI